MSSAYQNLLFVESQVAPEGVRLEPEARFATLEVLRPDLTQVEEPQSQSVDHGLAEVFHHVEGEGLAARADAMEEADGGVKSSGFEAPLFVPWGGTG